MVASVKSGAEISLEVTYDSPSLYVGAIILDDSGVSPSQVGSTLPMANYSGNSYRAKFTPEAGKTYLTNKAVYTDNTYATKDVNYSEGSDSFQGVDFSAGGSSATVISSEEIELELDSDSELELEIDDSDIDMEIEDTDIDLT